MMSPLHQTTTPPIAQTTPIQITAPPPPVEPDPQVTGAQSHGSHATVFPLLPALPLPHQPVHNYPSALQGWGSGRPAATGQPQMGWPEKNYRSGSGKGLQSGDVAGTGQPEKTYESASRMRPRGGDLSGMGHYAGVSHGAKPHSGIELEFGTELEEGLFDPAGLSTEDRVAAYLAAESGEGFTGGVGIGHGGAGEKRAAAEIGESTGSKKKPKKRKRI